MKPRAQLHHQQAAAGGLQLSGASAIHALFTTTPPALALGLMLLLAGCATAQRPDPLESINRGTFAVNEVVDKAVMKPVAQAYVAVVPRPVRTGVTNFFSNAQDAWSAANLFLQGRPGDGVSDAMRFSTNTVLGVLGIFDVATGMGMPRHGEDFGQTLGRWGMGQGAYIVLPLLGPSSLRDTIALPIDSLGSPLGSINDVPLRNTLTAMQMTSTRAGLLPVTDMIDQVALDKYLFVRDAYLQRRNSQVRSAGSDEEDAGDPGQGESDPGKDSGHNMTTAAGTASDAPTATTP